MINTEWCLYGLWKITPGSNQTQQSEKSNWTLLPWDTNLVCWYVGRSMECMEEKLPNCVWYNMISIDNHRHKGYGRISRSIYHNALGWQAHAPDAFSRIISIISYHTTPSRKITEKCMCIQFIYVVTEDVVEISSTQHNINSCHMYK
jgi:hypothetical protein